MAEPLLDVDPNEPPPSDPPADPPPSDPPQDPPPSDPPPSDPPAEPPKAEFPEDWRQQMAGEDEKLLKQLERFTTPSNMAKALAEAQAKIRSGELAKPLAEDATDEEKAAWREANGIPNEAKGYEVALPDDAFLAEEDIGFLDGYREAALAANMTPEQFNQNVAWYAKFAEDSAVAQATMDKEAAEARVDELREEWGTEFRANNNAVMSLFGENADAILTARTADGQLLENMPEFMKWAAQTAVTINPAVTLVNGVGNNSEAISSEIAKIEGLMGDRSSKYWKGPEAAAMQAKYIQLLEAQDKLGN